MDRYLQLLEAWRIADSAARTAEDKLLAATFSAVHEGAQVPSVQQLEHARKLRAEANELLKLLIAELRV